MEDAADVALNVVVIGPPGAGKGTQAERFAREQGIPKISTGDILRDAVSADTSLGRQVKELMDRGELVSDELITAIVEDRLSRPDTTRGFVLDGFPRTVPQAIALDRIIQNRGPLTVVEIQVSDDELVQRVRNRRICSGCGRTVSAFDATGSATETCATCGGRLVSRSDDSEAVVTDRLKVYWRETKPMVRFYQTRPTYRAVNGAQSPERVREALISAVASALGKPAAELQAIHAARPESNA